MDKKAAITFRGQFVENTRMENVWHNLPSDLTKFLEHYDGVARGITDILPPGNYDITIQIESVPKIDGKWIIKGKDLVRACEGQ